MWHCAQSVVVGTWLGLLALDTSLPERIAVVPLWQVAQTGETSACSAAPKAAGENCTKSLWQVWQRSDVGICATAALTLPLADFPSWQDTQVAAPNLLWSIGVTQVVNDVWQSEQFDVAETGMWGVGLATNLPERIATVPLWQSVHLALTRACLLASNTTGVQTKVVWQALQSSDDGICRTVAFFLPVMAGFEPSWQDTQVAAPMLE